jgi:hypothetical protein
MIAPAILGEEVLCYSPNTCEITFAQGRIVRTNFNNFCHLVSMQSIPGSSGSMVVGRKGVVGILTGEHYLHTLPANESDDVLLNASNVDITKVFDLIKRAGHYERFCNIVELSHLENIILHSPKTSKLVQIEGVVHPDLNNE